MRPGDHHNDDWIRDLLEEEAAKEHYIEQARQRIFPLFLRPKKRPIPWVLVAAGAAVAGVIGAVVGIAIGHSRTPDMSDALAVEAASEYSGGPENTKAGPSALHFADGSTILLEDRASVRTTHETARQVRVRLLDGTVRVSVVPTPNKRWHFHAGPYTIVVTGTRFSLSWHASAHVLELHMTQGSVRVRGPLLPHGIAVRANDRLHIDEMRRVVHHQSVDAPPVPDHVASNDTSPPAAEPGRTQSVPSPSAHRPRHAPSFHVLQSTMDAPRSLLERADRARLDGNVDLALDTYRRICALFPHTDAAQRAAFMLGRAYVDQGAYAAAATWFQNAIDHQPGGVLAKAALGRRIEALVAQGDHDAARTAARSYLRIYPDGPHARLAKTVVSQSQTP